MPAHGFSPAAITAFGQEQVEFYYLVRMDFSTSVYFTLAPYDISYDGNTYSSDGLVLKIPDIVETLEITPTTTFIEMSGASEFVHLLTVTELYRNTDVFIYMKEISTGETVQVFKGFIDSFDSLNDDQKGRSSVKWRVANHWSNWKAKAGRFISHEEQVDLFGTLDLGLTYASVAAVHSGFNPVAWNFSRFGFQAKQQDRINRFDRKDVLEGDETEFRQKLPLVYGTRKIEGHRVFSDFEIVQQGATNVFNYKYYWEVWVLAEGECDSIIDVTFDGESYLSAKMSQYVQINFHGGAVDQLADADMVAANFAFDTWNSFMRLLGICYLAIRYEKNDSVWDSSTPPQAPLIHLKGKKLFDPLNGQTFYETNNALVSLDYLTNSIYGKGVPIADVLGIVDGRNYCNTLKPEHSGVGAGNIRLFEFNGFIDTSKELKKNMEDILFTMRASIPYINGKYQLVINREDDDGTFIIDEDNINGEFKVLDGAISALANEITYDYIDIDDAGDEVEDQIVVKSGSLLAEDKGRVLRKSFSNKHENNKYRARNRSNTLLKEAREQIRAQCKLYSFDALSVEVGEIVLVSSSLRGWVLKKFRVERYKIGEETIDMNLREYEPVVYDWSVLPDSGITTNSGKPSPFIIEPPINLNCVSDGTTLLSQSDGTIVPRIKVTFDPPLDIFNLKGYRIYLYPSGQPENEILVDTVDNNGSVETFISDVQEGILYTVSVASFNSLGVSDRAEFSVIAIGKSALPAAAIDLQVGSVEAGIVNLFWTLSTEIDFSHYEVVGGTVNNRAAASLIASPISNTLNHATEVDRYYWVRVVDTSGNPSAYYPVSSTGGVLGQPNGLTAIADWETLTGRPYNSAITNTITFRHDFEDDEFGDWLSNGSGGVTQSTDSYTGDKAGLFTMTASGENVTRIFIPEKTSSVFHGKRIRVTVYAKLPATNATAGFGLTYNTNGSGGSALAGFTALSTTYASFSFLYDVPVYGGTGSIADFISVWADTTFSGKAILLDHLIIDMVGDYKDLAGQFGDIAGTDNIHNTFYQLAQPTVATDGAGIGDYWVDFGDMNKVKRLFSVGPEVWVPVDNLDIQNALQDALDAQATADGKITTFFNDQIIDGIPTSEGEGDLWFDASDDNKSYKAAISGANDIVAGEWELAAQDYADWNKVFGVGRPADNADVTTAQLAGSGVNVANALYTTFEEALVPLPAPANGSVFFNVGEKHSGFQSLSLVASAADCNIYLGSDSLDYNIPITPNKKWIVSVWVKKTFGTGNGEIEIYARTNESGAHAGSGLLNMSSSTGWQRLSAVLDLTGTNHDTSTACILRLDNNISGHILAYDELMMEEQIGDLTTPSAYSVPGAVVGVGLQYGAVKTFYQNAIPTSKSIGDIWYDADNNNKIYYAFSIGANEIKAGEWVAAPQETADWAKIFGGNKPADNADVSTNMRITVKNNFSSFSVADGGALAFIGYGSNGQAADVAPRLSFNGFDVAITKDYVKPEIACEGYLLWSQDGTLYDGRRYVVGIPSPAGSLTWDLWYNGSLHSSETIAGGVLAIGTAKFNNAASVNYSTVWGYGVFAADVVGYNADITNYGDYRVSNVLDDENVLLIPRPKGGSRFDAITKTAAIIIRLPQLWTNEKIKFIVDVTLKDSNKSFSVAVGGYLNSGSSGWTEAFAQIYGNTGSNNTVRFGRYLPGTDVACVMIGESGEVWQQPQITIRDVQVGGGSYFDWDDNWIISYDNPTGANFSVNIQILDALLDAKNILNQGVLATKNEVDTDEIVNNAVSDTVFSEVAGLTNITASGASTPKYYGVNLNIFVPLSLVIDTPVAIDFSISMRGSSATETLVTLSLIRKAALNNDEIIWSVLSGGITHRLVSPDVVNVSRIFEDSVPAVWSAQSIEYYLEVGITNISGGDIDIYDRVMLATLLKK